ncbi:MAG: hypothetical protein HC765_04230 [Brachymonas sp.]|nr:hypothetical protein [Brachymonas sp.]
MERSDSPWYPSMKLYRRDHAEVRKAQMGRVIADVKKLVALRASSVSGSLF